MARKWHRTSFTNRFVRYRLKKQISGHRYDSFSSYIFMVKCLSGNFINGTVTTKNFWFFFLREIKRNELLPRDWSKYYS